jgi:hypothetical protein
VQVVLEQQVVVQAAAAITVRTPLWQRDPAVEHSHLKLQSVVPVAVQARRAVLQVVFMVEAPSEVLRRIKEI